MDFCLSHFESLTPTNWLDPPKFGFSEWWIQHQVNPLGKSSTKNSGLAISYQSATSPRYAKKTKPCRFNGGWEKTSPCVGRCRLARLGPETVFEPGQRMTVRWREFRGYIPRSVDNLSPWSIILTHTHLRSIWTLFLPCQKHTSCFLGQGLFLAGQG